MVVGILVSNSSSSGGSHSGSSGRGSIVEVIVSCSSVSSVVA